VTDSPRLPWDTRDYDAWNYRHDQAEGHHDPTDPFDERLLEHGSHPAIKSPPKDTP
jgi:hypothetical protein